MKIVSIKLNIPQAFCFMLLFVFRLAAQDLRSHADTLADRYLRNPANAALSMAIVQGTTVSFFNYGDLVKVRQQGPAVETSFDLGGLSSVFTALLLEKAVQEKKLSYQDDIRKLLPPGTGWKHNGQGPIRLLHLVNHTSGLPNVPRDLKENTGYDSLQPFLNYSSEDVFRSLSKIELKSGPGEACEYSSYGIGLLGAILCRQYEQTYNMLLQDKICRPFNLKQTIVPGVADSAALPWNHGPDGELVRPWLFPGMPAAGGIRSSAGDLSLLLMKILADPQLRKAVETPVYTGRPASSKGWFISRRAGHTLVWQAGAGNGSRSFLAMVPDKNIGIALLSDSSQDLEFIGLSIIQYLLK